MFRKNLLRTSLYLTLLISYSLAMASRPSLEEIPVDSQREIASHLSIQELGSLALVSTSLYKDVFQYYYGDENYKERRLPSPEAFKYYREFFKNYSIRKLSHFYTNLSSKDFIGDIKLIFKAPYDNVMEEIEPEEAFQNFVNSYCGLSYIDNKIDIINSDRIFIHFLPVIESLEFDISNDTYPNQILDWIEGRMDRYFIALKEIVKFHRENYTVKDVMLQTSLNFGDLDLRFIPPEIGGLINLQKLNVGVNELIFLPPDISNLKNLTTLDASNNKLETLPTEIWELENLNFLNMAGNRLKKLPSRIGNFSNLGTLYITNNQLKTLPTEIWELEQLNFVHAANNALTKLPVEQIVSLKNLVHLTLERNQLVLSQEEIERLKKSIKTLRL